MRVLPCYNDIVNDHHIVPPLVKPNIGVIFATQMLLVSPKKKRITETISSIVLRKCEARFFRVFFFSNVRARITKNVTLW